MVFVFTTFAKKLDAKKLTRALLEQRLIACCNLLLTDSTYLWHGKIEEAEETLAILKTKKENLKKVEEYIAKNHPYKVPEIAAVQVDKISQPYLDWINKEIQ